MRNATLILTLLGATLIIVMRGNGQLGRLDPTIRAASLASNDSNDRIARPNDGWPNKSNSFCSLVHNKLTHTPSEWWTTHFNDIVNASQQPEDTDFAYRNWTTSILASLTPEMLQRGVRNHPSAHSLDRVLDIVYRRITHPTSAPPLQIAVVGGSVTRGQGCNEFQLPGVPRFQPTTCAWPSRLERLINTLAGFEVVKIYNLAVSATNLGFGTPLVKYRLYPDELLAKGGPDIIISSFSTNEQPSNTDTTHSIEWANKERARIQDFILATARNGCNDDDSPLVVFVDDYLGNRQDLLLGEMVYNKVVTELAEWYPNVWHVSFADVVRRLVYGDTSESNFSPDWPIENGGQPKVEVHFGMGGHVATASTVLYGMVDVISSYCDNQDFVEKLEKEGTKGVFPETISDLVDTVPPPHLTPDLRLQDVSNEWQDRGKSMQKHQAACGNETLVKSPCPFAFLAGPNASVRTPKEIDDYLRLFLVESKSWEAVMEYGAGGHVQKPGLVAQGANASLKLRMTNITDEIRIINLQAIRSYGEKWAHSRARFTVKVENKDEVHETGFEVKGFHASKSSVSRATEFRLENKAKKGSDVSLSIDLLGGTTFKILGLMLCNH